MTAKVSALAMHARLSPWRLPARWLVAARALALCFASALFVAPPASAHEMSMAEMQVREVAKGDYLWQWWATEKRPASQDLTPVWPAGCASQGQLLRCGPAGLRGTLSVQGVGERYGPHRVAL